MYLFIIDAFIIIAVMDEEKVYHNAFNNALIVHLFIRIVIMDEEKVHHNASIYLL